VADAREPFLSRWSRRKLETKEAAPASAENAAGPHPAAAPPALAAEPPAAEAQQTGTPGYREYFDPQVDESLRRTALKKLFSEPQFNVMDGLDTYIDDYSKPDPIPEAMLRRMNQAKDLLLFDDEKEPKASEADAAPAAPAAPAEAASLPSAADAADEPAGSAAGRTVAPSPEPGKNE
jgi:hypothetical protein